MHKYRTHTCDELTLSNVGESVKLSGFVRTIRDLGSVMFVDLKDHYGVTQLVTNDEKMLETMRKIPLESTICVIGKVLKRDENTINKNTSTGEIELRIEEVEVLGRAKSVLPFKIEDSRNVREDLRLEYRFLDLRNEGIHKKMVFRSKVLKTLRDKMDALNFVEIQTPILTSSSPEGARDFLVPSRLHPGEFYALPQAPQQFKQLLMISGFDKYYQIAPCFRDEDPRADRSPGEFYQLDFEMAFATQDDVLAIIETVVGSTFKELTTKTVVKAPFERIKYKEAMDKYGSDKPDLRNPLIIQDVTDAFAGSDFKVFQNKTIKAIKIDAKDITRKFFDNMGEFAVTELGLKGLAWIKLGENKEISGTISKFIIDDTYTKLVEKLELKENDAVFFVADEYLKACKCAGDIRIELGKRLDILEKEGLESENKDLTERNELLEQAAVQDRNRVNELQNQIEQLKNIENIIKNRER
jgi:aspartyl-tRNA synthetase